MKPCGHSCNYLKNGVVTCALCEIELLNADISHARKGLADYAQDVERLTDQRNREIERLTRELKIQKATVELAYIPHRQLVASRDRADAEIERLTRLLNARTPYYCQNCDCASCGNTRPVHETAEAPTYTALNYNGGGLLPDCDACGNPPEAHDPPLYGRCPPLKAAGEPTC